MTRKISLVNLSNWDHEDYIIEEIPTKPGQNPRTVLLMPGEQYSVFNTPYKGDPSVTLRITPVEREKPKPFYKDGRQIIPQLIVTNPYEGLKEDEGGG